MIKKIKEPETARSEGFRSGRPTSGCSNSKFRSRAAQPDPVKQLGMNSKWSKLYVKKSRARNIPIRCLPIGPPDQWNIHMNCLLCMFVMYIQAVCFIWDIHMNCLLCMFVRYIQSLWFIWNIHTNCLLCMFAMYIQAACFIWIYI